MSYNPITDFLELSRLHAGAVEPSRMPGLDYVAAALARAGLFTVSVGQSPPLVNQATTVWLQPAQPSWTAEGTVRIWDPVAGAYEVATPALWISLLSSGGYAFQSVATLSAAVTAGTSLLAVQRAAPAATALLLPSLSGQFSTGRVLKIVDWSSAVVNHVITLTTPDGASIMKQNSWQLLSTAVQLAGVSLSPSPDLDGWIIAP